MVCVPFGMGADAFAGLALTTAGRMSGGFFGHGGGGNTRASTGPHVLSVVSPAKTLHYVPVTIR